MLHYSSFTIIYSTLANLNMR